MWSVRFWSPKFTSTEEAAVENVLLNPGAWDKAGALVVLLVFVLLIALGRLLPRSWVDARLKEKDEQIADLKAANSELLQVGRTVEDVLVSMRDLAQRRRDHDDRTP